VIAAAPQLRPSRQLRKTSGRALGLATTRHMSAVGRPNEIQGTLFARGAAQLGSSCLRETTPEGCAQTPRGSTNATAIRDGFEANAPVSPSIEKEKGAPPN